MRAIELKNVSFSYSGFSDKVLSDVDFYVDYGEVALLSGLSGEGKSTLLSIASGIIPNIVKGEITGEVLVDGKSIIGQKLAQTCRKVGVVLQNADSQIIHRTVDDEIAFGCESFALAADKIGAQIDRVCTIVELDKTAQTRTLSGGQKQRLITASTLATGQRILILDEPLANLDVESANLLMDTLRQLAKAGYAVLVVEHKSYSTFYEYEADGIVYSGLWQRLIYDEEAKAQVGKKVPIYVDHTLKLHTQTLNFSGGAIWFAGTISLVCFVVFLNSVLGKQFI